MAYIYDLTDTWNAGGTTFNGIKLNVTDSASAVSSKLVTLQTNGTEHFSVTKAGAGYFSGNVGIGVTAPASKFEVAGAVRIKSANADTNGLNLSSDAGGIGYINAGYATVGQLVLQTQSTERMRIDSSGQVGIGTSSPGAKLDVLVADGAEATKLRGATGRMRVRPFVDATNGAFIDAVNTAENAYIPLSLAGSSIRLTTTAGLAALIDASGQVGIGTSSPSGNLHINGTAAGLAVETRITNTNATGFTTVTFGDSTTTFGQIWSGNASYGSFGGAASMNYSANSGPHVWYTNYTERMRIDSSGNLLVGTTAPISSGVDAVQIGTSSGSRKFSGSTAGSYNQIEFWNTNGYVGAINTTGTATTYLTSSDVRLKHDIVDAPEASSLIDEIQVRSFKWNADNSHQRYGFIAQELVTVAPEAVSQPEDPDDMMGVDYSKLVPMLVKELQSLRARVAQLEGN